MKFGFKTREAAMAASRHGTINPGVVHLTDGTFAGRGDRFTDGQVSLWGRCKAGKYQHLFSGEARTLGLIE